MEQEGKIGMEFDYQNAEFLGSRYSDETRLALFWQNRVIGVFCLTFHAFGLIMSYQ